MLLSQLTIFFFNLKYIWKISDKNPVSLFFVLCIRRSSSSRCADAKAISFCGDFIFLSYTRVLKLRMSLNISQRRTKCCRTKRRESSTTNMVKKVGAIDKNFCIFFVWFFLGGFVAACFRMQCYSTVYTYGLRCVCMISSEGWRSSSRRRVVGVWAVFRRWWRWRSTWTAAWRRHCSKARRRSRGPLQGSTDEVGRAA